MSDIAPRLVPTAYLPWFLRAPRAAGLWLVGVLIPVASVAAFVLSYRGLYDWAVHHGWPGYLAPLFPLLIDLLIIAGEVVLFVAAIDGDTPWWVRGWAWSITVAFTGLSVAGNVSHAATGDVPTRVGWGLPPVVLALALGFGLGILKRQSEKYRLPGTTEDPGAVADLPPAATVPVSTLAAAETWFRETVKIGNAASVNKIREQFPMPRKAATELRQSVLAETNGHGPGG